MSAELSAVRLSLKVRRLLTRFRGDVETRLACSRARETEQRVLGFLERDQDGLLVTQQRRIHVGVRHADIRDDRMILFTGAFSGKVTYHYAARAVTVGSYVYPALSASCMYDPDVRSVNGKSTLRVE